MYTQPVYMQINIACIFTVTDFACFVNQCTFLGCWLKWDFKLQYTILYINLDACYSTGHRPCSIMRVFEIHHIVCKFYEKNTCETLM